MTDIKTNVTQVDEEGLKSLQDLIAEEIKEYLQAPANEECHLCNGLGFRVTNRSTVATLNQNQCLERIASTITVRPCPCTFGPVEINIKFNIE